MLKFTTGISLLFVVQISNAAQWVTLSQSDVDSVQLVQANNANGTPEGLYIQLKADIAGEAASYCTRKNYIAITDPKLADRTYSGLMYAFSTQKTFSFYMDGMGKCTFNIPLATMFMLRP